jgi:hypothetical protein
MATLFGLAGYSNYLVEGENYVTPILTRHNSPNRAI